MAKAHQALLRGSAKVNDAMRKAFMPDTTVITLCRPSETENDYEVVLEIDNLWAPPSYDRTRQQFVFEIARDDDQLTEAMDAATHLAVNNDIYAISDGDTVPPLGTDVAWKLYCTRFESGDRFTILR